MNLNIQILTIFHGFSMASKDQTNGEDNANPDCFKELSNKDDEEHEFNHFY